MDGSAGSFGSAVRVLLPRPPDRRLGARAFYPDALRPDAIPGSRRLRPAADPDETIARAHASFFVEDSRTSSNHCIRSA